MQFHHNVFPFIQVHHVFIPKDEGGKVVRQYGIVWNSSVVEVAYTTCADIVEEFIVSVIFTTKFTTK